MARKSKKVNTEYAVYLSLGLCSGIILSMLFDEMITGILLGFVIANVIYYIKASKNDKK